MTGQEMAAEARRPAASGVLLVDKAQGVTSHDVVAGVRRAFGQREVGHTGTLDPMATGLLVLTLGRATRIGRFLEACDKRYTGTVRLGRATTTFDAEGETTETCAVPPLTRAEVERALAGLRGAIEQEVPAYSAVKVDGERLYAKARRGEVVAPPKRTVHIHELVATRVEGDTIDIEARVSKGTYIRSLAVQIGRALSLCAHLSALRRTRVGEMRVEDARRLEALRGVGEELIPMPEALAHLPRLKVDAARAADVRQGRPVTVGVARASGLELVEGQDVAILGPEGSLLAVGTAEVGSEQWAGLPAEDRALRYACVLAAGGA